MLTSLESRHLRSHLDKYPTRGTALNTVYTSGTPRHIEIDMTQCRYRLPFHALCRNGFSHLHFLFSINRRHPWPKKWFSSPDHELWSAILTWKHDLATRLGHRSHSSKVMSRNTHTNQSNCSTWTTKVVGKRENKCKTLYKYANNQWWAHFR